MHFVGWCHTCSQFTFGMLRYFILVSVWEQTCWVVLYGHAQYEQWKSVRLLFRYVLLWLGMCDTTQCFKSNQTIAEAKISYINLGYIAQRHLVFHFESPYLNMTNSTGPFGNIFMKSPNSERNTPSIQKIQVNDLKCVQKKRSLYSIWHVHMLPVGMQIWISQYGQ